MEADTAAPALTVRGISKTYRLWATPGSRLWVPLLYRAAGLLPLPALAAWLRRRAQARVHDHPALQGVDFSLRRGEALGIIGHNGSGKSTLLQIVAGVLAPSAGTVQVNGRVAALLELGSGFNPELTGRENVRVNAAILGLSAAQVAARMDDIIAFADIGDYIDEPVKTYSSGMALRLAFAVQVHVDPEILIVDEALAVGDAAFQAKAMTRIQQILSRGTTLLFVGHDLNALRAFCQRAILLEGGRMAMLGAPEEVIEEYLFRVHAKSTREGQAKPIRIAEGFRSEDGGVLGLSFRDGARHLALNCGDEVGIDVDLELQAALPDAACIIDILDERGVPLSGRRIRLPDAEAGAHARRLRLHIAFRAELARGIYRVRARLVQAPDRHQHHRRVLCRYESDLSFEVVEISIERFSGLFPLPADIRIARLP